MNNPKSETFTYTYSAKEQNEIQKIRKKYMAPEENKMEQLRRLDAGVTQKASIRALVVGILGALILGMGMSLTMTDLSQTLGFAESLAMPVGIGIGIVGMILVGVAYPIYSRTLRKERERIAPEILRLTDELMK